MRAEQRGVQTTEPISIATLGYLDSLRHLAREHGRSRVSVHNLGRTIQTSEWVGATHSELSMTSAVNNITVLVSCGAIPYNGYHLVRLAPSILIPGFWWTFPFNLATP
jgi:hypothetical protein